MVGDLVKACGTKKIIVLFSENTDLVSNIYRIMTDLSVQVGVFSNIYIKIYRCVIMLNGYY